MQGKISASMMCADTLNLQKDLDIMEKSGIEYLHIDVMDGHFVPNFTLGPDYVKALRGASDIPLDIHLMIENPENYIDIWGLEKGDIVTIHVESCKHINRCLQKIKETGASCGLAINPATPLSTIEYSLDIIDVVLVMTVNPGFAGQRLVPATIDKIKDAKKLIKDRNILIEVDGNVNIENAKLMRAAGADIFIAGSSGMFIKGKDLSQSILELRSAID